MGQQKKIIYVDFVGKKRSAPLKFGGGPRLTVAVFALLLVLLVSLSALFWPAQITSGFFAPTVIAVSVVLAMGFRRLMVRLQVGALHREMLRTEKAARDERTLH